MMNYICKYKTPDGFDDLVMCGDDEALTGLWFEGSRDDWRNTRECERRETLVFRDTRRWLDEYFAGRDPDFTPNYRIEGLTPFRQSVIGFKKGRRTRDQIANIRWIMEKAREFQKNILCDSHSQRLWHSQ